MRDFKGNLAAISISSSRLLRNTHQPDNPSVNRRMACRTQPVIIISGRASAESSGLALGTKAGRSRATTARWQRCTCLDFPALHPIDFTGVNISWPEEAIVWSRKGRVQLPLFRTIDQQDSSARAGCRRRLAALCKRLQSPLFCLDEGIAFGGTSAMARRRFRRLVTALTGSQPWRVAAPVFANRHQFNAASDDRQHVTASLDRFIALARHFTRLRLICSGKVTFGAASTAPQLNGLAFNPGSSDRFHSRRAYARFRCISTTKLRHLAGKGACDVHPGTSSPDPLMCSGFSDDFLSRDVPAVSSG